MKKRKKPVKLPKSEKHKLSLRLLQLSVFFVELILILGVLFLVFSKYYFNNYRSSKFEDPQSEIRKLPEDVRRTLGASSSEQNFRVPVLMYHYIEYVSDKKDSFRQLLNVEPHIFKAQLKSLLSDGYSFLTASELAGIIDAKSNMPVKPILITIDDGHWDIYTDILPIIKKLNVRVTLYIAPGLLNGTDFLTDKQLRDVIASGLVEIGSHTVNHVSLSAISEYEIREEIIKSRQLLENKFKIQVNTIAYPNGNFNLRIAEMVKENNYLLALSTIPGIMQSQENRFFLYRLRPGRRVGAELLNWLNQDKFSEYGF